MLNPERVARAEIKSVECGESYIKARVKSEGRWSRAPRGNDTSESHAGKSQVPRSEVPTLGAHVSFVGGADIMSAAETTRRREGHTVVRVSLRRGHIDPGGVSPFNGTWQIRWERAKLISLFGRQWGEKKNSLFFSELLQW